MYNDIIVVNIDIVDDDLVYSFFEFFHIVDDDYIEFDINFVYVE